jgi:16S rRNA (guanine527-N7)-methyltransferase
VRRELAPGLNVSRETFDRLTLYEMLLRRWQQKINLVSNSTLSNLWLRHFADSAQVLEVLPEARSWADLGSGAGFPGLVTAIQLIDKSEGCVHLIESDGKKCAFLREVARETGARAEIHRGRIEDVVDGLSVEAVSARALAPMAKLLEYAAPLLKKGAVGVFLKGQDIEAELTGLTSSSRFKLEIRPSRCDPRGKIAIVSARSDL